MIYTCNFSLKTLFHPNLFRNGYNVACLERSVNWVLGTVMIRFCQLRSNDRWKMLGLKSDDSDCFFFNLKMTLKCDISIPTEASVMQNVGGGTP